MLKALSFCTFIFALSVVDLMLIAFLHSFSQTTFSYASLIPPYQGMVGDKRAVHVCSKMLS